MPGIFSKLRTLLSWYRQLDGLRSLRTAIRLHRAGSQRGSVEHTSAAALVLRGRHSRVYLRPGTADFTVFRELFVLNEYGLAAQIAPEPVRWIVDLGTNVGLSVAYFGRLWPEAKVIGVEPDENNLRTAELTLGPQLSKGMVFLHNAFIGPKPGTGLLDESGRRLSNELRLGSSVPAPQSRTIPIVTVSHLLEQYQIDTIDLLKCDIEGAEVALFADCSDWINRVRTMVVELHDGLTAEWLLKTIAAHGGSFSLAHASVSPTGFTLVWLRAQTPS